MALTEEGLIHVPGVLSRYVRLQSGTSAHYSTAGETGRSVVMMEKGVRDQVRFLREFVEAVGIEEPFLLAGNSQGAQMGASYAARMAVHRQSPAENLGSLPHRLKPEMAGRHSVQIESDAIVAHLKAKPRG